MTTNGRLATELQPKPQTEAAAKGLGELWEVACDLISQLKSWGSVGNCTSLTNFNARNPC